MHLYGLVIFTCTNDKSTAVQTWHLFINTYLKQRPPQLVTVPCHTAKCNNEEHKEHDKQARALTQFQRSSTSQSDGAFSQIQSADPAASIKMVQDHDTLLG